MGETVESLHAVPQRVRVEHESGARHDVRPVARLVLLQQKETLMLLGLEPLDRQGDALCIAALQVAARGAALRVQICKRDQPPERGVDAAEIPEVRLTPAQID